MSETRKIAAILVADVVGYSRLAGADEDRTLARLRALRSDLIDPTIAVHHGRVVKRTGDGVLVEFRSVVDAVRCATEIQNSLIERNAGVPTERRLEFRVGVHLGDVVEEADGDLMGDGVNIAARLESICKPGEICLSEDAYRQVRGRLDLAVTDLGPKELKNIAEPIRVYALEVGVPAQPKSAASVETVASRKPWASTPVIFGIAALLTLLAGGAAYLMKARAPETAAAGSANPANAERFSIVVLPFANLSGDPGQDYLADALTDELTTYIAQLGGAFVIARNTAFTFKGKPFDVKAIGRDLGVKYALEGSVQPTANRVRVNAQLIDTESGAHVWAESFDEDRAELLQMEDDIVTRLARTVGIQMIAVEAARAARARPGNPDAQDLALRCIAPLLNNPAASANPSKHSEIYEPCERALSIDPHNTLAMAVLSTRLLQRVTLGEIADPAAEANRFDQLATEALAVSPNDQDAHIVKASAAFMRAQPDQALLEAERVMTINPSAIFAYAMACGAANMVGQPDKAIDYADKALRLSPRDPSLFNCLVQKSVALSMLGRIRRLWTPWTAR